MNEPTADLRVLLSVPLTFDEVEAVILEEPPLDELYWVHGIQPATLVPTTEGP